MNRFAALLDRLAYEPSQRQAAAAGGLFPRDARSRSRYALAAITGALSFRHAKPGIIRADRRAHRPGAVRVVV
jgi:DNA ligase-1